MKIWRQEEVYEGLLTVLGISRAWEKMPNEKSLREENQTIIMPKIDFKLKGIMQNFCVEK